MILVGKLDKRIKFFERYKVSEDTGSGPKYDYKDPVPRWGEFITDKFGSAVILGDGEAGVITRKILVRSGLNIAKGWKASWKDHTFVIRDVDDSTPGQLTLTAEEISQ